MAARETNPNFMNGVPELLILRLLQQEEMYGYEIVQAIRSRTDAVIAVGEGVVYPVLHGLERDGALRSRRKKVNGRSRIYYSVTVKGSHRLDDLAKAMIEKRQFQSWCVRAPWAMFGLAPLCLLAGAYFVACVYLWFGWKIFLPGADTPFVSPTGPIYGIANMYFQAGKFYYFSVPVLVGWAIGLIAARQRLKAVWPTVGLVLIAWMGATSRIHASRTAVPGGLGHISMNFFTLGASGQAISDGLLHA